MAVFNSVVTLAALTLAYAVHGQLAYELKWKPKRGEVHVYELFIKDMESSVEAAVEHKVTDVRPDGTYAVQSRSLGALVRVAGSELRDDRSNEANATYDAFGRLWVIVGGTVGLEKYRHALLTKFVAPNKAVQPGALWTYQREKDTPVGLAACKIEYKFARWDSISGLAEVEFALKEQGGQFPQSADGKWWVDGKTGLTVKMEAKVKNFVGSESAEAEVKLVLRKPA